MCGSPVSELFQTFSDLFRTFPKFFQTFWLKTGFFGSKTQTLRSFFKNFEIDVQFLGLKFLNFFPNFFAKILRVRKFRVFPKNFWTSTAEHFWTSTAEHFWNSQKLKVQKILSNASLFLRITTLLSWLKSTLLLKIKCFDRKNLIRKIEKDMLKAHLPNLSWKCQLINLIQSN